MEPQSQIPKILKQVKSNKKYSSLADEIVLDEIKKYLRKNPDEKINKLMIKGIRSQLHRLYSSYLRGNKNKRNKFLEELKINPNNKEMINKILQTAVSTKERLDDYESIYKQIFNITNKPKSIIDLGCGLNPLSFSYMNLNQINYYAYDIDEDDIEFINEYFKIMKNKINGKAEILDVRNQNSISNLPSSDIIFIFKLIDLIDIDNHKTSEELIKILIKKTKFIVASFSTKTITKKSMNFPNRKWFELMLNRIGLKYETFSIKNEVFYIINYNIIKSPQII